jgi:hypothetical protein
VLPLTPPPFTFTQQVRTSRVRGLPCRRRRSALELRMVCAENVRRLSKSLRKGRCSGPERTSESWRDGRILITCVRPRRSHPPCCFPFFLSLSSFLRLFSFPAHRLCTGRQRTPHRMIPFFLWHKDTRASLEAQEEAYRTMNRLQKHAGRASGKGDIQGCIPLRFSHVYCLYSHYVFKLVRLSREEFVPTRCSCIRPISFNAR